MENFNKNYRYNKNSWISENPYYLSLFENLYAGENGEVIADLQFSYQSYLYSAYEKYLSNAFKRIADEDNSHKKTLAETIVLLGGKPEYKFNNQYVSGKNILTNLNTKSYLQSNISFKEKTIINYKTTISKIDNNYLKNLLTKILQDEEYHLEYLKKFL